MDIKGVLIIEPHVLEIQRSIPLRVMIPTAVYPAVCSFYSVLDKSKIKTDFGIEILYWKDSLAKCLNQF